MLVGVERVKADERKRLKIPSTFLRVLRNWNERALYVNGGECTLLCYTRTYFDYHLPKLLQKPPADEEIAMQFAVNRVPIDAQGRISIQGFDEFIKHAKGPYAIITGGGWNLNIWTEDAWETFQATYFSRRTLAGLFVPGKEE